MFSPEEDLNSIWLIIRSDPVILSAMGLTQASDIEIARRVIKRDTWDDLSKGEKRINIYFCPSLTANNDLVSEETIEIDVHVPAQEDYLANRIQAQVRKLLHGRTVNHREISWRGQLGALASLPGFTCVGARYKYYIVI